MRLGHQKSVIFGLTIIGLFSIWMIRAHADSDMVGHHVSEVSESKYPYVCKLEIGDFTCSGTLVSPTQVLTAGHCFGRYFNASRQKVNVSCGGNSQGRASDVKTADSNNDHFWQTNLKPQIPQMREDFAVVTLGRESQNTASALAKGPDGYFDATGFTLPGVSCYMMGYGKSNQTGMITNFGNSFGQPETLGTLMRADLIDVRLQYTSGGYLVVEPLNSNYLLTSVDGGDSGGPLLCARPGLAPELMGVIVLYYRASANDDAHRRTNVINPVWINLNAHPGPIPQPAP